MFDRDVSKKLTNKEKFDEFFSDLRPLSTYSYEEFNNEELKKHIDLSSFDFV
jgi:hypothetical protein